MTLRGLGARIKELRERRGLSPEALAEKAGLSGIYVRKLEAGERDNPSVDALEKIAQALDATLTIALAPNRAKRRRGGR